MRALVLISGLLLSAVGVFCFLYYTNTFFTVAFVVGLAMLIAGIFNVIAYFISGKGNKRLTETTMGEGIITFLFGVSVLCNQITDATLCMFFGTWITTCAVMRFSQSRYVRRFNSRDWLKLVPFSLLGMILGFLMILPSVLSSVMPLMLVGGAFLLDGLSMIVYSMYMKKSSNEMSVGEARAKARAEAKKEEHEAKIAERNRLASLSQEEREKEEELHRLAEAEEEKKRSAARAEARAARRAAMRTKEDITRKLSKKEEKAIKEAAAKIDEETIKAAEAAAEANKEAKAPVDEDQNITDANQLAKEFGFAKEEAGSETKVIAGAKALGKLAAEFESSEEAEDTEETNQEE